MFLDMCFLTFIAYRYKYVDVAAPKNLRKISVLSVRMEGFVTTETNNSITEMPNQEPRKPSTKTTETIELNTHTVNNYSTL